jgi:hypothetical protein
MEMSSREMMLTATALPPMLFLQMRPPFKSPLLAGGFLPTFGVMMRWVQVLCMSWEKHGKKGVCSLLRIADDDIIGSSIGEFIQ